MTIRSTILLTLLLLSGCVSTPAVVEQDSSLNLNNATKLVVYRPSSDIFGAAEQLRAFINNQYVGSLNSGGSSIEWLIQPGATKVEVKPYFLGIQDGKIASLELHGKAGDTLYLRLSRDIGIPIVNGHAMYVIGSDSGLTQVSEISWADRK